VAAQIVASRVVLSSTELVSYYYYNILFPNPNVFCSQLSFLIIFVCLVVFCFVQIILHYILSLSVMYLRIYVLCCVCNWPCDC
jgi:hypothetical protein